MNIFKLGLLLSVLIFNLSCGIIPDDTIQLLSDSTENTYDVENDDMNVTDNSFITLEPNNDSNINHLVSYLEHHEINNVLGIEEIDQLPHVLRFTNDQITVLETEIDHLESSSSQKKILKSLLHRMRDANKE